MCHYTFMYVQYTYRILQTCFGLDAGKMLLNPGSLIEVDPI